MLGTRLQVTPYQRRHRSALLDLAWRSHWTHKHLDWFTIGQWIDRDDGTLLLAWHGEELVGYIGLSPPIDGWSWVRLLAIRDGRMPGRVVRELWRAAEACRPAGIRHIAILMVTNWLPAYFASLGFQYEEDIITLCHTVDAELEARPSSCCIRAAEREDLPQLARIDRQAFPSPWQLSDAELWQSLRLCAEATVALDGGEIVGFQLCTRQGDAAHLARLAVAPAFQGRRIGTALVARLLRRLHTRKVETISVNTQANNLPSQRLYARLGFARNGYDLELWRKTLRG